MKLDHFNENAKTIFDMTTTIDVQCSKVKTLYGESLLDIFGFNIIICKYNCSQNVVDLILSLIFNVYDL